MIYGNYRNVDVNLIMFTFLFCCSRALLPPSASGEGPYFWKVSFCDANFTTSEKREVAKM